MHTAGVIISQRNERIRIVGFQVYYWYRSEDDQDRSVRQHCQMTAGAASSADILREVQRLQAQGYEVQRVQVRTVCPVCHANARVLIRTYKTRPPKYKDCSACQGNGLIGPALEFPISVPAEMVGV
jgi:hypothetical protein